MDLQEIREIREITGQDAVNAFLNEGWILLSTTAEREGDHSWFLYSLGWPKDLPSVRPHNY